MKKLFKMIRQGNVEEVKRILEKKPELITCLATAPPKKDDGQSPLMVAIKSDNLEVAHLLLDFGADVNFVNGPEPLQPYDVFAPIWDNAIGQCFLRARNTVSEEAKTRTEQYFELLCRLLDMGMDINKEITTGRRISRPKNAWRVALEQYSYFAHTQYSSYNMEGEKAADKQLRGWLQRILEVLSVHGAFIYDFDVNDEFLHDDIDRIIRNMIFNRDIRDSIGTGTEYELRVCPQWFEIKWQPVDAILRPYYMKDNPYYGAEVSLERALFFDDLVQREQNKSS